MNEAYGSIFGFFWFCFVSGAKALMNERRDSPRCRVMRMHAKGKTDT